MNKSRLNSQYMPCLNSVKHCLFQKQRSRCFTHEQDIEDLLSQMPFHWPKGVLIRQVRLELGDRDFATLGHIEVPEDAAKIVQGC